MLFNVFDEINAQKGAGTLSTIVTIHGNGAFESAVADAVDLLASERGYGVLDRQDYDQSGADFRPILNRFSGLDPDVVFMVSYAADSVALARQIQEVGLDAKVFAGGAAGFALPGFIEGAGPATEYVYTATMWTKDVPYPGAQELNDRLTAILGRTPSYHAAQAYAGIITAVDVLERAASDSPADIQAALAAIRALTPPTRQSCLYQASNAWSSATAIRLFATWAALVLVVMGFVPQKDQGCSAASAA